MSSKIYVLLTPNIKCFELVLYVAVQFGILHHKHPDREGMSPDRNALHEPA